MAWKPSRSSGVMFDKFRQKSDANRAELIRMIEDGSYLRFENMNKLSKHIYLHWLNENKAHCALVSKRHTPENNRYDLEACCILSTIYKMLIRNKELVYKPFAKYLVA